MNPWIPYQSCLWDSAQSQEHVFPEESPSTGQSHTSWRKNIWEKGWPFWMISICVLCVYIYICKYTYIIYIYPQNATEIIKNHLWNFNIDVEWIPRLRAVFQLEFCRIREGARFDQCSLLPGIAKKIAGGLPQLIQTTCVSMWANLLGWNVAARSSKWIQVDVLIILLSDQLQSFNTSPKKFILRSVMLAKDRMKVGFKPQLQQISNRSATVCWMWSHPLIQPCHHGKASCQPGHPQAGPSSSAWSKRFPLNEIPKWMPFLRIKKKTCKVTWHCHQPTC